MLDAFLADFAGRRDVAAAHFAVVPVGGWESGRLSVVANISRSFAATIVTKPCAA
jgi:hypothetical protein